MKMMRVKAKKIINIGSSEPKQFEITELKGLGKDKLPFLYWREQPYATFRDNCVYVRTREMDIDVCVGYKMSIDQFNRFIAALGVCGDRLKSINDFISKEAEGWSGDVEVTI